MWYVRPQLGWLPLIIALVPWIIRAAAGLFLFQPTPLDLPMALFLATAAPAYLTGACLVIDGALRA